MSGFPAWTEEEFEILLTNSDLHDVELASKLSRRSTFAVRVLRDNLHYYHTGIEEPSLSEMMRHRLNKGSTPIIKCARCGEEI